MPLPVEWANPATTRSRVVLEIAAELVAIPGQKLRQAKVLLRGSGSREWELALFGSATVEGVEAVANGEAAIGMINPSTALRFAYLGTGPFSAPQPVRTLAVIPSLDQCVMVVRNETGLETFEEIAAKRYPLKISTRGTADHSLQFMLEAVLRAGGCPVEELRAWGGEVSFEGEFPRATGKKIAALKNGTLMAMFEEGVDEWLGDVLEAGCRVLPFSEATIQKLEAVGFRRAFVRKATYPQLPADVLALDFSGWPIFVHVETPDALVRQFCAALDARKHLIPWQGEGPLPVELMSRGTPAAPVEVPLHPGAEAFWREKGYLS
jgi:TRAP-type uncharacterized transport system substrate-binding protein